MLALPLSSARAEVQTFYFGGQVFGFHDPLAISPFNSGDSFDGWYSFETTTAGEFPRGYDAVYLNAITGVSITIGGLTYTSGPGAFSQISLENAGIHPEITSDLFSIFAEGLIGPPIGDGTFLPSWTLSVRDHSGEMLPDLSLPTSPPSAFLTPGQTGFDIRLSDSDRNLLYFANGGLSYFSATPPITTPIPEPETYAILLAGLALLGFARRRSKTTTAAA